MKQNMVADACKRSVNASALALANAVGNVKYCTKMGAFAEFELSFLKIKGKLCAGKIFCARLLLDIGDSLELDLLLASKKGEKPR